MDVKIFPSKLDGVIEAVSNKAHAQRVFLASILSKEKTDIYLQTPFQEIKETLSIIKSLGGLAVQNDFDYTVSPAKTLPTVAEFSCGDQISTIKFIAPVLSALKVNQRIELSEKLRKMILERTSYTIMYHEKTMYMHHWYDAEYPRNWTPWCSYNCLLSAILLERDYTKLVDIVEVFWTLTARRSPPSVLRLKSMLTSATAWKPSAAKKAV